MQPAPVGKSGVLGKGLMSISVNKATKFPNASIALAQFFTNPRSMVQFAKQVAVYPSSPAAYDDPFFADAPTAVEDSARPLAEGIISTYAGHRPDDPEEGRRQRHRPQGGRVGAVQQGPRAAGPDRRRRRRPTSSSSRSRLTEPSTANQRGPSSGPVPPPARSCPPAGTGRHLHPRVEMTSKFRTTPYLFLAPALVLLGHLRRSTRSSRSSTTASPTTTSSGRPSGSASRTSRTCSRTRRSGWR